MMNSISKRMIAGLAIASLANVLSSCSPVFVAQSRPRPVIYSTPVPVPQPVYATTLPTPPVQTVVVTPVVPVWAPPYVYVNEVHYYYFPDYMVYYDVFAQNYWYFDGFSWVHVISLPSMPVYYGFDPYNSYIVVMNRHTHNPWIQHSYFEQQYPRGYYKSAYAPRQSLGSNTILRAYDENESRPVFVDKRSNKEVKVKYDVKNVPQQQSGKGNVRPSSETMKPQVQSRPQDPKAINIPSKSTMESRPQNPKTTVRPDVKKSPASVNSVKSPSVQNTKSNPQQESVRPAPRVKNQQDIRNNSVAPKNNNLMQQPSAPVKNSSPGSMHKNETKPLNAVKKQPLSPSHPSQDLEKNAQRKRK